MSDAEKESLSVQIAVLGAQVRGYTETNKAAHTRMETSIGAVLSRQDSHEKEHKEKEIRDETNRRSLNGLLRSGMYGVIAVMVGVALTLLPMAIKFFAAIQSAIK